MDEFKLIEKYFLKLSKKNKSSLNLNDDVFFDKKKGLAITIDTYIEGNHFLNFNKPDLIIKKIIRSSISDLVCKGIIPKFYFISASGNKKKLSKKNLLKISKSLKQEQDKYGIVLSGGDTVYSNKLSFSITSVGYAKNIKKYDGFLALGCVIKGETPHFDFISQASTNAIMDLSIKNKKPIGNGIITCLNMRQAKARKKKGAEAANAVISILSQK